MSCINFDTGSADGSATRDGGIKEGTACRINRASISAAIFRFAAQSGQLSGKVLIVPIPVVWETGLYVQIANWRDQLVNTER